MKQQKIVQRILKKIGVPRLVNILANEVNGSDLQSLLLEISRRRAMNLKPRDVMAQYCHNRFVKPAIVDPVKSIEFDRLAFSSLPDDFEVIELSPVCPIGTNSVVAPISQNNTLTTTRNTEVCSDSTNVLALECSRRRRAQLSHDSHSLHIIRLCASHRLLRTQPFDEPVAFPHFRLLCLCTAGRDQGSFQFEIEALTEHICFFLNLILTSKTQYNFSFKKVKIVISSLQPNRKAVLDKFIITKLGQQYNNVVFKADDDRAQKRNYYCEATYQIWVTDFSDHEYLIVDAGFTDWTQQLLSNKKERFLSSGMGSERFLYLFAE